MPRERKPKRTLRYHPGKGRIPREEIEAVVKAVHVAPTDGEWLVLKVGPKRIRKTFPTQDEALGFARKLTSKGATELILHQGDGVVRRHA